MARWYGRPFWSVKPRDVLPVQHAAAAEDPLGSGAALADGVEAQAERALRNLQSVLDAAGLGFDDVVKTTIFLADIGDFAAVNAVYARFIADPPPARSTVQVAALPKGGLVEIEAIARRPQADPSGRPSA